ncbi:MAG TPA: hypothetical protein VFI25_16490 [Planctomycetota bacterium]|nr:hypothetical protein [Planctomycetota bacterium]
MIVAWFAALERLQKARSETKPPFCAWARSPSIWRKKTSRW